MKITVLRNNRTIEQKEFSPEASESLLIGRGRDCHIVLDDRRISRVHAEIVFDGSFWKITAKNQYGTLNINGIDQAEKALSHTDLLRAEPFDIKIEIAAEMLQDGQTHDGPPSGAEEEAQVEDEEFVAEEGEGFAEEEGGEFADEEGGEFADEEGGEFADEEGGEFADEEGGEFADEGEYAGEDESKTAIVGGFASYTLGIFGEHAPYDTYAIEESETLIGRNPERCHIVLRDPEASSVHCAIKRTDSQITIEDRQSGNGTILNGKRINKAALEDGDEFVIGSTSFSYSVRLDLMTNEEQRLMPVEENQSIEVEEVVEVDDDFDEDSGLQDAPPSTSSSLFSKDSLKDPEKRKKISIIAIVLLSLWVFLGEEEAPAEKTEPKEKQATAGSPQNDAQKEVRSEGEDKQVSKEGIALNKDQLEYIEQQYVVAKETFSQGKYQETLFELDKVFHIVDEWKEARQVETLAKEGLKKVEEQEKKRKQEEERRQRALRIQEMLVKAKKAVEDRKIQLANSFFAEILKLEPDNFDVPQLKLELETWQKEEERKRIEEEAKKVERQRKVDQLSPGKSDYLQKKWYSAILRLEAFLRIKGMDEDLIKESSSMLEEARAELKKLVDPLISKARSLREGQDLKGAYEHYNRVLVLDPSVEEALNEVNRINEVLNRRARNVYIEGLIAENLSMFKEAKEKFQEVQQISPSDNDYYQKASDKLKNYFD